MTHAWCQNIPRDEAVRAAEDNRQGPLPTLEEAISGVTERRPPEPGGGGNVTLRTERVTLEITTFIGCIPAKWPWRDIMGGMAWIHPDESVRVVEEASALNAAINGMERAQRERDDAISEYHSVSDERDAAIRERDKLRGEITSVLDRSEFASMELTRLRNRVAELESAAKLAPAANAAAESNHAPAASGNVERKPMQMPSREWFERMASVDDSEMSVGGLSSRVAELESSAPAASGAAGTGVVSAEQPPSGYAYEYPHYPPPVATVIRFTGGETINGSKPLRAIPYWFAPQPAKGWLTEEERKAVQYAIDRLRWASGVCNEAHANALDSVLARSSPPEVVLPVCEFTRLSTHMLGFLEAIGRVKKALAAAGVPVKEVGRE